MWTAVAALSTFIVARYTSLALHEFAHALVGMALGGELLGLRVLSGSHASATLANLSPRAVAATRHGGWLASLALALLASFVCGWAARAAAWLTAAEALLSDLLGCAAPSGATASPAHTFFCGNFGLLLLDMKHADKVPQILRRMLQITMMRGAQSAGLVSYAPASGGGAVGTRARVVNGKRTDLCEQLLRHRKAKAMLSPSRMKAPLLFQGHTRFATSSISNLNGTPPPAHPPTSPRTRRAGHRAADAAPARPPAGCHPHQWCPPQRRPVWTFVHGSAFAATPRNVEGFITHNGDLDFFEINGVTYALDELQLLLPRLLHSKLPAAVDSVCLLLRRRHLH